MAMVQDDVGDEERHVSPNPPPQYATVRLRAQYSYGESANAGHAEVT